MDIHEYQAKQLLSKFGVVVPPGEVVYQTHEAENIVSWLNEEKIIVKAQVHAGGRGKAGGVKLCKNNEEVVETVDKMIGMKIITPQTNEEGKINGQELLVALSENDSVQVKVEATINSICQKKGCWMSFDTGSDTLFIKFRDYFSLN